MGIKQAFRKFLTDFDEERKLNAEVKKAEKRALLEARIKLAGENAERIVREENRQKIVGMKYEKKHQRPQRSFFDSLQALGTELGGGGTTTGKVRKPEKNISEELSKIIG